MFRFLIHKKTQTLMNNNYSLNKTFSEDKKPKILESLKKLLPLMKEGKNSITMAWIAVIINSALNLIAPFMIWFAIDNYIRTKNFQWVIFIAWMLLIIYVIALFASYFQTLLMWKTWQVVLFNLRNSIFWKLQSLPVAFFNQNKVWDLISRINNDTDKLNQFFSQSLVQFISNMIMIIWTWIFILYINFELWLASLIPALLLFIFTRIFSPWIKNMNSKNLKNLWWMSSEIAESLENFKVIVAFNRRDYFRNKFRKVNEANYRSSLNAWIANNTLTPAYWLFSNLAQLIVIIYWIFLISTNVLTIGILISFLIYINRFYEPLRQMAALWSNFQVALSAWDRIYQILSLDSDLRIAPCNSKIKEKWILLEFNNVSFAYSENKKVLDNINFKLEPGKTYALVWPTWWWKTTLASLMSRLYDPTEWTIYLNWIDLKSYNIDSRVQKIWFILQEPFLFTGNLFENIIYWNILYRDYSIEDLGKIIESEWLKLLLDRFPQGLETKISSNGSTLSLWQKQLIAFIRAILRSPDLLILDEATANIDTITEQLLQKILDRLPKSTTKVIIAHRLNTIENANEIFFINSWEVINAGSMEHAINMLLHSKRES